MRNSTLFLILLAAGISYGQFVTFPMESLPAPPSFYNWEIEGQFEWNTSINWLVNQNERIFNEPDQQECMYQIRKGIFEETSIWEIYPGQRQIPYGTREYYQEQDKPFGYQPSHKRKEIGRDIWRINSTTWMMP